MGFCCISLLVVLWWFLLRWILDSCFFLWVYSGFDSHQHLRNVFGTWPIILTTHLKGWLEMIPIDQGLLDFRSPGESMFSHELRMPYIYIYWVSPNEPGFTHCLFWGCFNCHCLSISSFIQVSKGRWLSEFWKNCFTASQLVEFCR